VSSFAPPYAPCNGPLPHYSLKGMEPRDHALKLLKSWAIINLSSFKAIFLRYFVMVTES
jgi:hypothetical protein